MRLLPMTARLVLICVLCATPAAAQFTAPEPEDLMIYQVFLDRFNNGDPTNDNGNPRGTFNPSGAFDFHGGDLEGIRQQLAYVAGMGFNGMWITPFVENVRDYHGYGAYNWFNVDPNFGDLAKLQQLITEANAVGIAIYFDMVAGHQGNLIDSLDGGYPSYLAPPSEYNLRWNSGLMYPAPFNQLTHFHAHGVIGNFFGSEQEFGELVGLDDLKTDTQFVRDQMFNVWNFWLTNTGVSGFRIDTVKHIDIGFWEDFLPRMRAEAVTLGRTNYFTFGEIFGGDDSFMSNYIGTLTGGADKLDAALDFQFYFASQDVFARATAPPSNITSRLQARATNLPGHHLKMPNFFDNHDVRRFMNVAQDNPGAGLAERRRRLELALIFTFMAPGPPVIYYGTEQEFDGGNDPSNREDMFDGQFEFGPSLGDNFDTSAPLYQLVARLASLRSALSPLRRGDFNVRTVDTGGPGHMAFTRTDAGKTILTVLNTSTSNRTLPSIAIAELASTTLANALNPVETIIVPANGILPSRTLPGQAAEIWVLQADLPPLPTLIVAQNPANGEIGVDIDLTEIAIDFSEAMNRTSTEAATSLSPITAFTFAWNAGSTRMRLVLGASLAVATDYTVTVTDSAMSQGATPLQFTTAATWTTGQAPLVLPPFPAPLVVIGPTGLSISVNGNDSDWPSAAAVGADQFGVVGDQTFVWHDAPFDDTGAGAYTYPTNSVFTGGDADLEYFRFAYDASNFYFLFRPVSINPGASFFTAYFGVGIDLGVSSGSGAQSIGFDQNTNATGTAELLIRDDADMEYQLVFTGPRGATLLDSSGTVISTPTSAFSQSTGVVEIAVPRGELGLAGPLAGQAFNLFVYVGLETFGNLREVEPGNAQWSPGGGIVEPSDPDVFDLAGASGAQQVADIAGFTTQFQSTIINSVLPLSLNDAVPVELSVFSID